MSEKEKMRFCQKGGTLQKRRKTSKFFFQTKVRGTNDVFAPKEESQGLH